MVFEQIQLSDAEKQALLDFFGAPISGEGNGCDVVDAGSCEAQ